MVYRVAAGKMADDVYEFFLSVNGVWLTKAGADECLICGRKQEDMKSTSKFNPDEMLAKMQTKEYVIELKDVLMEYIKDIDSEYRMELLEIMESGLQYEKTRGNMKDTVIEKVEKVFEGH